MVPWREEGEVGSTGVFFSLSEQTQQTEHRGCCSCDAKAPEIGNSFHNSIYLRKQQGGEGDGKKEQYKHKRGEARGSPSFPSDTPFTSSLWTVKDHLGFAYFRMIGLTC